MPDAVERTKQEMKIVIVPKEMTGVDYKITMNDRM